MSEQTGFDREIGVRGIVQSAIWLLVVTVASFLVAWAFYREQSRAETAVDPRPSPLAEAQKPVVPPGPRLQATPEKELAAFRLEEEQALETWAWVDAPSDLAQVPVERAIEAVAETGKLPDFNPPAPEPVTGGEQP